ncbi:ATP-binding protein [Metabacillus idriensis]|uniref:ATP-binding protein n=1 Tax=Metabacillus idriensis TaxID=324768 RepID=UPI003D278133
MNNSKFFNKSLARQFGIMTGVIIFVFTAVITLYVWYQNTITSNFEERNRQLDEKESTTLILDNSYNLAISEFRAYFAYGENGKNKHYYNRGIDNKKRVLKAAAELEKLAENDNDYRFLQDLNAFYQFYFVDQLPNTVKEYENGNTLAVSKKAVEGASETVRTFQKSLQNYSLQIDQEIEENRKHFTQNILFSQICFLVLLIIMVATLIGFIRRFLRKIQKPLNTLTVAASEIAAGRDVIFDKVSNRSDELGLLHKAFSKMSKSIQEKEQDLTVQNEELQAQQDELQAQQEELKSALEMMWERESQLMLRNELSNGISNTLNKKEILNSIIATMCRIVKADKGVIMTLDQHKDFASVSLSESAVSQLRNNLDSGLILQLKKTKEAAVYKREAPPEEKGYHQKDQFSYDLYLPVISSSDEADAVMIFTRFASAFNDKEIKEYSSLSKNIAVSLDKIKLFEQSEADREMTKHILNTIHEGIQLVDINGVNLQMNIRMQNLLMKSHEINVNHSSFDEWSQHFSAAIVDPEPLICFLKRSIFSEHQEDKSYIYKMDKGMVIQVYIEPLYRNGRKFGTVMVHRDITKEYEVDQMKSEFVSTVSHELRTPLASVLGFTELMLYKDLKPERQKKYLMTILQEGKRLTSLINEFLDVQRMEAGKQTYEKRFEELSTILQTVIENQQIQTSAHRLILNVKADFTTVFGDRDKLAQVFQNILSNAVKYSPDGGDIKILMYEEENMLKIDVEDKGLGIPEEAVDKLFSKFYRVDNSDRRKIGGTGLGLAIVKEIIKEHDGEISVSSRIGKGSVFTVALPLASEYSSADSDLTQDSKRANVMIIEDDQSLASLLKTEFEESGFNAKVFNSGEEALIAIKSKKPDAVVLDIMLDESVLTGWDILHEMNRLPELNKIPIFISSALDEKEKGMALGAYEFLIKPYQPSKLSNLVLQALLSKDREAHLLLRDEGK